jgi:hypothetical protein
MDTAKTTNQRCHLKILVQSLILLALFACQEIPRPEKPFVIIYKNPSSGMCGGGTCRYIYIDKNGNQRGFCEDANKYFIGDTIK